MWAKLTLPTRKYSHSPWFLTLPPSLWAHLHLQRFLAIFKVIEVKLLSPLGIGLNAKVLGAVKTQIQHMQWCGNTHSHTLWCNIRFMHYQTEQLLHDRWIKSSSSPTWKRQGEEKERCVMCMCLYLCVLVCVHLSSHSGIVNTDSFQLESALFNKQTSREESREVYKEMTQQHKTSAPQNHQGEANKYR